MKILVIVPGRVGDICLQSPSLVTLCEYFENSYITILVRNEGLSSLIARIVKVDVLFYPSGFLSLGRLLWSLRKRQFDLVIDMHYTLGSALLSYLTGAKSRIGLNTQCRGFLFTQPVPDIRTKHELERALDIISALGIDTTGAKHRFCGIVHPHQMDELRINALLTDYNYAPNYPLIVINPGSRQGCLWPIEKFANVAAKYEDKFGIIIIGGQEDVKIAASLEEKCPFKVANLCGKTTIPELAALLKRCVLLLTTDSGPMHLAVAVGRPVVAIFGPTDPQRWAPWGTANIIIRRKDMGCMPCAPYLCREMKCLSEISAEEVREALDSILGLVQQLSVKLA